MALIREIREELGCTVHVGDFVTECVHVYPAAKVHLFTYYAKVTSGTPTPQEHARLEWVPVDGLRDLNWAPADVPTVKQIIKDLSPNEPESR